MDIRGICVLKIFGSVGGELLYVQQASCKINDHRTLIMTWLESRCAKMENCNDLLITFGNNGFDMQKLAQKKEAMPPPTLHHIQKTLICIGEKMCM